MAQIRKILGTMAFGGGVNEAQVNEQKLTECNFTFSKLCCGWSFNVNGNVIFSFISHSSVCCRFFGKKITK